MTTIAADTYLTVTLLIEYKPHLYCMYSWQLTIMSPHMINVMEVVIRKNEIPLFDRPDRIASAPDTIPANFLQIYKFFQEGRIFSRQCLNEYLETLHLAPTQF